MRSDIVRPTTSVLAALALVSLAACSADSRGRGGGAGVVDDAGGTSGDTTAGSGSDAGSSDGSGGDSDAASTAADAGASSTVGDDTTSAATSGDDTAPTGGSDEGASEDGGDSAGSAQDGEATDGSDTGEADGATTSDDGGDTGPSGSPGCGLAPEHAAGGVTVTIDAGPQGDGQRSFYLSLPADYDPNVPSRLIVGYPGTSWIGEWIQPYLDLEGDGLSNEIFVYPDPLWRDFEGWGNLGGWVLGPNAQPAHGMQDLVFTEALLDYLSERYCIDPDRIFATGHSWGGDMAMVVACFLGDRFRATVPVAANRPYWFEEPGGGWTSCVGDTAVWTLFGEADDHFTWQDHPGQFGQECRDFWLAERGCEGPGAYQDLGLGAANECVQFEGCSAVTRYCEYSADFGHQVPDYFSEATKEFFRSF